MNENPTHKDDGLTTHERIYYTLDRNADRTTKLVCLLIERLVDRGLLSEAELDAMLLELTT